MCGSMAIGMKDISSNASSRGKALKSLLMAISIKANTSRESLQATENITGAMGVILKVLLRMG